MSLLAPFIPTISVFLLNELQSSPTIVGEEKLDVVLLKRSFEGLSKNTQDLIQLVTLRKDTEPTGSFKWKVHRYPSDIDIFEPVKECCDPRSASKAIAKKFQSMAKKIKSTKGVFLGDFKAGLDKRYYVDMAKFGDFDSKKVQAQINKLREQNLISNEEFKKMSNLVKSAGKKLEDWEELNDMIRKYYIVRWNLNELERGFKTLPKNVKLSLEDAIQHKTIVKIDLWADDGSGYNEITNFFLIVARNKDGKETILNQELGNYVENIEKDIRTYSSPEHLNSLKFAKRLWNKAAWNKNIKMMKRLYPLFGSDAARLNTIAGESEVIRFMVEKLSSSELPAKELSKQVNKFKRRINDTADFKIEKEAQIYKLIDRTANALLKKPVNKKQIIENLKQLEKLIKEEVESYSSYWLKKNGLDSKTVLKRMVSNLENGLKTGQKFDLKRLSNLIPF
jgi:hypothetical protein